MKGGDVVPQYVSTLFFLQVECDGSLASGRTVVVEAMPGLVHPDDLGSEV